MEKLDTDRLRLQDILNTIADIDSFAIRSLDNRKELFACAYGIAIIGEAANQLSVALKEKSPHIPWAQIIGMRHRIIHAYGNVNKTRLQEVISGHLPILKRQIQELLETL